MAEEEVLDADEALPARRRRAVPLRLTRWLGIVGAALAALLLLLVAFLHTGPGRQLIVDEIGRFAPASGLKVSVGAIDGSVLWSATLHDVEFRDAEDVLFLEIPEIDLNWRPYRWFTSGLDIRHLVLNGGTLHSLPQLNPGDPDAPLLPDFDIRVDRLVIDGLQVDEGIIGEARVIDFDAKADIRDGRVMLDAEGALGGADRFALLVDSEPERDRFDLDATWNAPAGGLLAEAVGAESDLVVRLEGDGSWSRWRGDLIAVQGADGAETQVVDLDLINESGQYRVVGNIRPAGYVTGLPARALGALVAVNMEGTLEDSVVEGNFVLRGAALDVDGGGAVDLADNAFRRFTINADLLDPTLLGADFAMKDARLEAVLDGPFRDLTVPHTLTIGEVDAGGTLLMNLTQRGTLTWDGTRATLPLDVAVARVKSGNELIDPRLVGGTLDGTLTYTGAELLSDDLALRFLGLSADLDLRGNLDRGTYHLAGPAQVNALALDDIGRMDARANLRFAIGSDTNWRLTAQTNGRINRIGNSTLANLAGEVINFRGGVALGSGAPIDFNGFSVAAPKVELRLDGRVESGTTTLAGTGSHVDYGPFTVEAQVADDGPRATLVLADPLPAAGLSDVRVALAPVDDGFTIETSGGSMLGAFEGLVNLVIAEGGDTTIGIDHLDVAQTRISGDLLLADGGVDGTLDVARGGVDGTIALATRDGGQGFDVDLNARNARFGDGQTPIAIGRAQVDASGFIAAGSSTVDANMTAQGLQYGSLFIGRMAGQAQVENGTGRFDAALTGARGTRLELRLNGRVAPERIAVAAEGNYEGRDISMPRHAVLLKTADGGWQLQRSQLSYGSGYVIASGRFGGTEPAQGRVSLGDMPLSLADIVVTDLGLGGSVSGVVELAADASGLPTGQARLKVSKLTRSSALLSSQPMDIALVAELSPASLQARAVISDDGGADGRLQARIASLPPAGTLTERLYAGSLRAQLRYEGQAAALWRLAAVDLLDITGELSVTADATGTLANPRVSGALGGDELRVRSALTGTDIRGVKARGTFAGSRLQLTSFAGTAPNGGAVSGSGMVDLAGITEGRGPQIDLRMATRRAELLDLPTMGATVTGPMRIVSNGVGGTIAGRLNVTAARWRLGGSEVEQNLPDLKVTETNLPADRAPAPARSAPWRYLIDARANDNIKVDGLGLDSEWRGDVLLRGTTDDPRIGGSAQVIPRQGFYEFAGVRFDITRGEIAFDENVPVDPRVDIVAETQVDDLSVQVTVRGPATQTAIAFSSTPALPEEELLARLLFGGSITDLSATDALQLGAAVASLRGGGGLGPINQLRDAIGLDRLRVLSADPALGRETAVALGKNINRRLYAEIVTDGRSYNASELEFRVTSWLSLLGAVNSLGRKSAGVEYRKDY